MLRFARWKVASIIALILAAVLTVIPTLLPQSTRAAIDRSLPGWAHLKTLTLGLDLQGGSYVLLKVDGTDVVKTMVSNLRDDVRRILREEKVAATGGIGVQPRGVQFRVMEAAERAKIMPKLRALASPQSSILGSSGAAAYDINDNGSGTIQISVTDAGVSDKIRRAVEQSIEVIRRRIDALGTTEPSIQRQGNDRIAVEVPGLQNPERLKQLLGQTAKLEFRMVAQPGENPADYEMLDQTNEPGKIPVEKRVLVQGEDLTDAQPGFDQQTGQPIVNFRFNIRGGQRFAQATTENVGRPFAIVLDNKVISAPNIREPILQGSGQISGNFTVEQANDLAILLRAGALPAKLTIIEEIGRAHV